MHTHHIIPKYRGGSDDSANLIEVTVTRHAMFHYCNWRLWGDGRDKIAWKSLSNCISEEERLKELSRVGGKNNAGTPKLEEHRENIRKSINRLYDETDLRKRISEAMVGNTNSQSQKSEESRKKHSEIMKAAWARRKSKQ